MAEPTIIEGGVNDSIPNSFWDVVDAPVLDPARYVKYFNDFMSFVLNDWDLTNGNPTVALDTAGDPGGQLGISTSGVINNDTATILEALPFQMALGKRTWCAVRAIVGVTADSEFQAGIKSTAANGIYIRQNQSATLELVIQNGSGSRVVTLGTITDTVAFTAGWYYDGGDEVHAYFNDNLISIETGIASLIDTAQSAPRFDLENHIAAIRSVAIDYFFGCQDR
ncbi:MAG: hypothetical protein ACR2PR_06945 [Pseudohongiellaceae bacterium]